MSTENRVESNLSSLVARRTFRPTHDSSGMGFREELLNLSFETQFAPSENETVSQGAVTATSTDLANAADESKVEDTEHDDRESEERGVAYALPQPQQSLLPSPPKTRGSGGENDKAQNAELVKPAPTVEKSIQSPDRPLSGLSRQSNESPREQVRNQPKLEQAEPGNTKARTVTEKSEQLPEIASENVIKENGSELATNLDSAIRVHSESVVAPQEPRRSNRGNLSDPEKQALQEGESGKESSVAPVDRSYVTEESSSAQDFLPNEQEAAPVRSRRISRQDRIREGNDGDSKREPIESRQNQDRDPGTAKSSDESNSIGSLNGTALQSDGFVVQAAVSSQVDVGYTVAGQSVTASAETNLVSGVSGAAAASTSVTAGALGGTEKTGMSESGSVQPMVGTPKGDGATAAGRGSGRAEAGTGASPLSRFQQSKLVQRVLKGLEQLSSGGGQVKLRLHPPELGTLQMTLKIEANVMSAHLEVENSLARDALLNNLQGLRDRLSEQGMSIDRFEVEVRTDSQSSTSSAFGDAESNRQSRRDQPESRYAIYNENRLASDAPEDGKPGMSWFRTTGKLDLSV